MKVSLVLYVPDVLKHDFIIFAHRLISGIFDLIAVAAGARSPQALRVHTMYTGWSLGQNVSFDPVTIPQEHPQNDVSKDRQSCTDALYGSLFLSLLIFDGLRHE